MRFDTIKITGGQPADASPRTAPGDVPVSRIKQVPDTLQGTDQAPTVMALTLEGTAAQTVSVTPFAVDEATEPNPQADPGSGLAARRFYQMQAAATVVTVGAVSYIRCIPGRVALQLTAIPAADAVLKIGYAGGAP
jgi:hypothetical protein